MTRKALFFSPLLLFCFLAPAHADNPCAQPVPGNLERFCKADADGNGSLSQPEFLRAFPDLTDQAFLALDGDGNGFLDAKEWLAHRKKHGNTAPASDLFIAPPKEQ